MRYLDVTAAAAILILGAGRLAALPIYQRMFQAKYNYKPDCTLCHRPDDWELNAYGISFAENGRSLGAFAAMEKEDADGDGFSSGAEIQARSNPGDPRSTPGKPGDWLANIEPVRPPVRILREFFPQAERFELRELNVDQATRRKIEKMLGRPLRDEDLFPTFFEAYGKEGRLGAALYASSDGSIPAFFLAIFSIPPDKAPLRVAGIKMLLCSIKALRQPDYLEQFNGKTRGNLKAIHPPLPHYAEPSVAIVRAVENGMLVLQAVDRNDNKTSYR